MISTPIFLVAVGAIVVGLFWALVTLPHWFGRSIGRHRLWRLRDEVVDDVIFGRLPADHAAVRQLVRRLESVLRDRPEISMLDLLVLGRQQKHLDPSLRARLEKDSAPCPTDDLGDDARALLDARREEFKRLIVGMMLLGSWAGIVGVLSLVPPILVRRLMGARIRDLDHEFASSAREATDKATTETRLGRRFSSLLPAAWRARERSDPFGDGRTPALH